MTMSPAASGVAKSDSGDGTTPSGVACTVIAPTASTKSKTASSTGGAVNNPPQMFAENTMFLKHKRRYCRIEGCNSIVKSQGLCQRHGAKPKTCKVEGCTKQAQGNFDKMCKAHFKAMKRKTTPIPKVENTDVPPPAQGFSVYDEILPNSLNFVNENNTDTRKLPLIVHLKDGFDTLKPPAWHRNEERRARGMFPIDNPAAQLEGWERELVWMEILVLTGVPGASFRHLARAWGRDKGFHMVLAQFICERHGDVERKKRHGEKNKLKSGDTTTAGALRKKRRKPNAKQKSMQQSKTKIDNGDGNGSGSGGYNNEDVGADVWDPSIYGDVDTNEALAAEIFDFTEKEFERVVSKYKQGPSSDISESTSTTNNTRNMSASSTDIVAQAAMTAILGQQQQQHASSNSSSTGHGPAHHRSNSMLSSASNGSSPTKSTQEDILPTPVHVEVTPAGTHTPAPTLGQNHNPNHPNRIQSYHDHLTSVDPMYTSTHQQHIQQEQVQQQQQQQQVFQDQSQVQVLAPPMQVPGHTYQQRQTQGQTMSHQIIQQQHQQPPGYNMHTSAPSAPAIQPHIQSQAQLQPQSQTIPASLHPTQQSEAHAQSFSQSITYGLPSGQQQQHALSPVPSPAQATQFSQSQVPHIQQQQQQHQMNVPSYPQHKQEQLNHVGVSYDQQHHQLRNYETAVSANPPPQQSHAPPQQMVHIPVPHQHHVQQQQHQEQQLQLQYAQTNIAPESAPVELAPRGHPQQHQMPFPPDQHQQIHSQAQQMQSQTAATAMSQINGEQIVGYPPHQHQHQRQEQEQEHLDQLMNHPGNESVAQDPLDVHNEMHATQEDQADM